MWPLIWYFDQGICICNNHVTLNLVFWPRNLYLKQLCGPQSGISTKESVFAATMWPSIWYFDQGICICNNYVALYLVYWPRNLYLQQLCDSQSGILTNEFVCNNYRYTLNLVFWPTNLYLQQLCGPQSGILTNESVFATIMCVTLMLVFWPTNLPWTYRAPIFMFSSWGNFHPCARSVQTLRQGRFYWICSSAYVLVKQIV